MYKLLIADDEQIERDALKYIISHNFPELFDIREAKNGREALDIAGSFLPDLIFLDIKMPGISGLQAAAQIRTFLANCRIIIVTAYQYFNYAKEALTLGAVDYITKPAGEETVVTTVKKIIANIEAEHDKKRLEEEKELLLKQITRYFEDELLALIAYGEIDGNVIEEYLDILNSKYITFVSVVASVFSQDNLGKQTSESKKRLIKKDLVEWLKNYFQKHKYHTFIRTIGQDIYILLMFEESLDEQQFRRLGTELFSELNRSISTELQISLHIGIGSAYDSSHEIYQGFIQAKRALGYEMEPDSIVNFGDIQKGTHQTIYPTNDEMMKTSRANAFLTMALEYMEQNYQKDLSLEDVAKHIQISPFYLSKIFKKETEENFIDFLTRIRIQKAKEFLTNPLINIKEVCYQVGYKDPNYFARVFKKTCGMTPTEFQAIHIATISQT